MQRTVRTVKTVKIEKLQKPFFENSKIHFFWSEAVRVWKSLSLLSLLSKKYQIGTGETGKTEKSVTFYRVYYKNKIKNKFSKKYFSPIRNYCLYCLYCPIYSFNRENKRTANIFWRIFYCPYCPFIVIAGLMLIDGRIWCEKAFDVYKFVYLLCIQDDVLIRWLVWLVWRRLSR